MYWVLLSLLFQNNRYNSKNSNAVHQLIHYNVKQLYFTITYGLFSVISMKITQTIENWVFSVCSTIPGIYFSNTGKTKY